MNSYSKIKLINQPTKSKSIDFADLPSFPLDSPQPVKLQHINVKIQEPQIQASPLKPNDTPPNLQENEEQAEGSHVQSSLGAAKLSRNRSVSAAKQHNIALHNVVQKAFSMRRSSSVSERYCRIHDQCVTISSSPLHDNEDDEDAVDYNYTKRTRSVKKKKGYSSSRILKACKRLLGI